LGREVRNIDSLTGRRQAGLIIISIYLIQENDIQENEIVTYTRWKFNTLIYN